MEGTTRSRRTVVQRMREQMALKAARARARELGIPLEAYLDQREQEQRLTGDRQGLEKISDVLADRIAERLKGSASGGSEPKVAFDDLQGIVDQLLKK